MSIKGTSGSIFINQKDRDDFIHELETGRSPNRSQTKLSAVSAQEPALNPEDTVSVQQIADRVNELALKLKSGETCGYAAQIEMNGKKSVVLVEVQVTS